MKFEYFTPNPDKNRGDLCCVRSICKGTEQAWEDVYPEYEATANERGVPINNIFIFEDYLYQRGWRIDESIKEGTTVEQYADNNKGVAILDLGDHASCLVDDVNYDMHDCGKDKIVTAWRKD